MRTYPVVCSLVATLAGGCTAAGLNLPPPASAHAGVAPAGRARPCWRGGPRCISTTVRAVIHAPREQVFDFVVAEDTPKKVLRSYGLVPAVTTTRIIKGPWGRVGALRIVHAGSGTLRETITHFRRPRLFAYRIFDFHNALGWFARLGVGYWTFEPVAGGTRVRWTYAFEPRSPASDPILSTFVCAFYRGYMRNALSAIARDVEQQQRIARRGGRAAR